jgi:23S rRNA pseudouridine955/2504/2580 synthase
MGTAEKTDHSAGVRTVEVAPGDNGARLDRWFRRQVPGLTQGRIEKLLRTGQVRVDGGRAKAGQRLDAGQRVRIPPLADLPPAPPRRPDVDASDAEALRARVLYRDDDMLVIDKPAGLAVQGGSGTHRHLDAMLEALRFGAPEPPRLVHRLDKDTSGVLVLARTAATAASLTKSFRVRLVRKIYWALTIGVPSPASGTVRLPLAKAAGRGGHERMQASDTGAKAVTRYTVVARVGRKAAWVALEPETGRTHQLRAHMEALGTPIAGDRKYRKTDWPAIGGLASGLHLHAREIRVPKPGGGGKVTVTAPLPPHMEETWARLGLAGEGEGRNREGRPVSGTPSSVG